MVARTNGISMRETWSFYDETQVWNVRMPKSPEFCGSSHGHARNGAVSSPAWTRDPRQTSVPKYWHTTVALLDVTVL